MQVHYDEGVAIHIGPEPCVGVRKDADEASVGEGIGQPLSRESQSPGADAVSSAEGNTFRTHHRKVRTCGACDLMNAAIASGLDATTPSRSILPV